MTRYMIIFIQHHVITIKQLNDQHLTRCYIEQNRIQWRYNAVQYTQCSNIQHNVEPATAPITLSRQYNTLLTVPVQYN